MSTTILLISSADISEQDLSDFIVRNGGVLMGPDLPLGRVSDGDRHIWIDLSSDEMESWLGDIEDAEEGFTDRLIGLLGGEPHSLVSVEVSRTQGSGGVALDFANRFAERWPSVVEDADHELLCLSDLCEVAQGRRTAHPFAR